MTRSSQRIAISDLAEMCTFWRESVLAVSIRSGTFGIESPFPSNRVMTVIDFTAHAVALAPIAPRRRYVGVLTASTAQSVRRVIAPFGFAIETCDPDAFLEHLSGPAHVCAIIDPTALDQAHLVETVARLRRTPRPAVVCAPSFTESIQDAVRIASETGAAVAIQSLDQDRAALVRTLLAVVPPTDAAMILELLGPTFATLPPMLRKCLAGMFDADAAVESPATLAARAGMSRRSLDRWLTRAGAPSARRLVAMPPLLRALRLLRETTLPIRTIATICGLRTPRRLHDYTIELAGLTPNEIRTSGDAIETLIERMATSLAGSVR